MNNLLLSEPVVQIVDFFTPEECVVCIAYSETLGYRKAKLAHTGRNNLECFSQNPVLHNEISARLAQLFPKHKFLLSEYLEFYKYDEGHFISAHTDKSKALDKDIFSSKTLLIYLNDDFDGGGTIFPAQNITTVPQTGMLVLFDQNYLLHEGDEIRKGRKYIIRTDISFY
jgi:hypothetical protein